MRVWILAGAFLAACASPPPQTTSAPPAPTSSRDYSDARSHASDADVTTARRAYRAACEQGHSTGYCECMTGGMAQSLAPADLNIATAALAGHSASPSADARARVSAAQTQSERACAGIH